MRKMRKIVLATALMCLMASASQAIIINGQEYSGALTLKEAICEFFGFSPDQCYNL
jgi:hypothetical protein